MDPESVSVGAIRQESGESYPGAKLAGPSVRQAASERFAPQGLPAGSAGDLHLRRGEALPSSRRQNNECSRRQGHQALAREGELLNTDAESTPGVLVNQNGRTDQLVAPVKKKAVGAAPKAARAAKTTKAPRRDRHGHRRRRPGGRRLSADIAAAMTSHLPSRRDATPDAAPASRNAMARPRRTKKPRALRRRKPQSSLVEGRNRIGARYRRKAQQAGLVEARRGTDGGHRQFVARQRAVLSAHKNHLEHNRSLEHPRNRRPEFAQRRTQQMRRGVGHRERDDT
jgi:hypothetical protein